MSRTRTRSTAVAASLATAVMLGASAGPSTAGTAVTENWVVPTSTRMIAGNTRTALTVVKDTTALDGSALRLTLPANPDPTPSQGVWIISPKTYRYGTFSSRMKTADCSGQDHVGVVTATFTYGNDGLDHDGDGMADNNEIDIEFLCAQPNVVHLVIWTGYDEHTDTFKAITRVIDLRSGRVLQTCYREAWTQTCRKLLPGENSPTSLPALANYDSSNRYRVYGFDWLAERVTFFMSDNSGHKLVIWDYRGPKTRIPRGYSSFQQSVWHTKNWDPSTGPAHNKPARATSALIDSTTLPG